jgi:hypothetical protein
VGSLRKCFFAGAPGRGEIVTVEHSGSESLDILCEFFVRRARIAESRA